MKMKTKTAAKEKRRETKVNIRIYVKRDKIDIPFFLLNAPAALHSFVRSHIIYILHILPYVTVVNSAREYTRSHAQQHTQAAIACIALPCIFTSLDADVSRNGFISTHSANLFAEILSA